MRHFGTLPEVLPVFPLSGALLLPRMRLPLHVYEPRYLQMLDDVLKTRDRMIGLVQPVNAPGQKPRKKARRLHGIGCAGRVISFSETEDRRYMMTLGGVSRFSIVEEVEGFTPYRRAQVAWDDFEHDLAGPEKDDSFCRDEFMDLLERYFKANDLSADWDSMQDAEDELLINSLAMLCAFEPEEKQALLEAPTLAARRETLETLIEFALRDGAGEVTLQ